MKNGCIVLALALWMGAASCSTMYLSNKNMMKVQQGMTPQQVENILGKPNYRRFDSEMEEWEYQRIGGKPLISADYTTLIVRFRDGKLINMDTFQPSLPQPPQPIVVAPLPVTTVDVRPPLPSEEIRLMTNDEWSDFAERLKWTFMSDDKRALVAEMLQKYDVTSAQCVKIVKEFSFVPDQVEMMKQLYPYVTDKSNFNQVVDILFSETNKENVRKFIKEYHQKTKK